MVTKRRFAAIVSFAMATLGSSAALWAQTETPEKTEDKPVEAAAPGQTPAPEGKTEAPAGESGQTDAAPAKPAPKPSASGPVTPTVQPRVFHAAVYSAPPGEPLDIRASFDHPELIRKATVFVTTAAGVERVVDFKRGNEMEYVATLPADLMKAPGFAYAIEIEHVNGSRMAGFATREAMHPVTVIEDITDTRERALLARLGGRRSIISVGGEYVGFGENRSTSPIPCGNKQETCAPGDDVIPTIDEHYYRIEAGYTYRSLRTVSEFGFRLGVLRGRSLKTLQTFETDKYDVGLNFGAARVRFRILDLWQVEGELLTSITEEGFSSGFNIATHIGDPYGTKLILGFERLGLTGVTFGNRIYSRMDIVSGSRLTVSPIIEITDMPNARTFGVRLLAELSLKIAGGFSAQLRGGYQARKFDSGGPGVGGSLSYAF